VKQGSALAFIWDCIYQELEAALRRGERRICVQKEDIRSKNAELDKPHAPRTLNNYLTSAGRNLSPMLSSSGIAISSERHAIVVQVQESR
jgi:hypothetical protein